MKKPLLLIFNFLAFVVLSFSQPKELIVKAGARGLFFEHKVAAKENFYSIGRLFNVHPRKLAAFNGLTMTKGLSLGQLVNVPLSDTNFVHHTGTGIPVYYLSTAKQTAAAISTVSKTPVDAIRKMNRLSTDNIAAGKKVMIGYLVNDAEHAIAENTPTVDGPVSKPDVVKTNEKTVLNETSTPEPPAKEVIQSANTSDGYFKASFVQQVKAYPLSKDETVTSGIFKTTSGWNDAKFYALIDGVEPGTIIKIVNPVNNKEVYAKVLGQMSGIRQNQGLNLRISNAAAAALEIAEPDKFVVKVNY